MRNGSVYGDGNLGNRQDVHENANEIEAKFLYRFAVIRM